MAACGPSAPCGPNVEKEQCVIPPHASSSDDVVAPLHKEARAEPLLALPRCRQGHALEQALRGSHVCDTCGALGTGRSCTGGCDYDLCDKCYREALAKLRARSSPPLEPPGTRAGLRSVPGSAASSSRASVSPAPAAAPSPGLFALEERLYRADNSELQAETQGLPYMRSKQLEDVDQASPLPWGTNVAGVDLGDGWVQVGDRFLPTSVRGVRVLVPQPLARTASKTASSASAASAEPAAPQAEAEAYLVDNGLLEAPSRGLQYRLGKDPAHRDGKAAAAWGSTVRGVDEGDGWLRVGDRYLPMEVNGVRVLTRAAAGTGPYEGHWLREPDGLHIGEIRGGVLRWSAAALGAAGEDGASAAAKVALGPDGALFLDLTGARHVGRLESGRLVWSDGEVWRPAAAPREPSFARVDGDTYEACWLEAALPAGSPGAKPCSEGARPGTLALPSGLIRRMVQ